MKKLFTEEQENYILDNYKNMTYKELADKMSVTYQQINSWINSHIKNKCDNRIKYTSYEEQFILDNYNIMTYAEIANILNRSEVAIKAKAENMGIEKIRKFNKDYFKCIDTANKSYWVGFIYADGYVIHNEKSRNYELGIEIHENDQYMLDFLIKK